jgi:hypothetical protein
MSTTFGLAGLSLEKPAKANMKSREREGKYCINFNLRE